MQNHHLGEAPHAISTALQHTRKHLCSRIDQLVACADAEFIAGWPAIVAAAEAAFRHEESVMELVGYPGLGTHRAENARTLGALHHASPAIEDGDVTRGRQALAALAVIVGAHRYGAAAAPGAPHLRAHGAGQGGQNRAR